MVTIYEDCPELDGLSHRLLCSYNRLADHHGALQSFGDDQGERFDFYRLFRLVERGDLPTQFRRAVELLSSVPQPRKDTLLAEVGALALQGRCSDEAMALLDLLGYTKNGRFRVPVFLPEHRPATEAISTLVQDDLGPSLISALQELGQDTSLTAVRHGVDVREIANELYHILFGSINEELVRRELVVPLLLPPGEGRYLQCVESYE